MAARLLYASMRKHHTENTRRHHADLRRLHTPRRARDLRATANLGERDGATLREDGMKKITVSQLRKWGACYFEAFDGTPATEAKLKRLVGRGITPMQVAKARIPIVDRLWVLLRDGVLPDRLLREFACDCSGSFSRMTSLKWSLPSPPATQIPSFNQIPPRIRTPLRNLSLSQYKTTDVATDRPTSCW